MFRLSVAAATLAYLVVAADLSAGGPARTHVPDPRVATSAAHAVGTPHPCETTRPDPRLHVSCGTSPH